jgi:hypothetical protein
LRFEQQVALDRSCCSQLRAYAGANVQECFKDETCQPLLPIRNSRGIDHTQIKAVDIAAFWSRFSRMLWCSAL